MFAGGDREEGLAHLERAVALDPESPRAQEALGVRLDQVGRREEAGRHLEKALALRPRDGRILNNAGFFHLRHGDYARAEDLFRRALREDTRDEPVRSRNLGMALAMQGRFDEAFKAFRKAGDEQSARNNLGYAHHLRGEYEAAIDEYQRAIVAGGDASVQVVRNLESAKRALEQAGGAAPALPGDDPWQGGAASAPAKRAD